MAKPSLLVLAILIGALAWATADNVEYTFGSTLIRFLGKSPNFQIYPNRNLTTYLQLRFAKFEERDASDQKVNKHSIESLASADPVWTVGNKTNSDGANYTYVSMVVDPESRNGFDFSCSTSGRRMLAAPTTTSSYNSAINVTMYFGFDKDTSFTYGFNKSVNVSKGGIKFSVSYTNWQFCNSANTLNMQILISLKGNATAQPNISSSSDGSKQLSIPLGDNFTSTINFANYSYEAVNGNRTMPVGVTLDTSGGNSVIALKLPNPNPNTTVYYDPTVTTSTVSGTGGGGGSASAARLTFWSAAAALLLSAFLLA